GRGGFFVEDIPLPGAPARTAMVLRPVRRAPARLVQTPWPGADVVLLELDIAPVLLGPVRGQVVPYEGAHLVAESTLFRREFEIHAFLPCPRRGYGCGSSEASW